MEIPLDEVIHFDAITTTPSTGAAVDADSTPTFAVYEEATDTDIGIGGNLTKRTSLTGNYRGTFTLSAANGFEVGKWYSIIGSAVVGGVTGKAVLKNFRVVAAEAIAGKPKADVDAWLGTAASTPTVAGVPNVNAKTWNDLTTVALPLVPTTAGRTLDVSAGGEAGVDWANVGSQSTSVNLSATTVNLVNTLTTYTGNTLQTANVATLITTVGTAGAGLTDLGGFSITAKAQINTEADTALTDYDGPTNTEMVAAFTEIKGATWATTDTLEAIRDRGDAAWITATGFSTLTQTQVTGGAYALNNASFAFHSGLDLTTTQKASVNTEADTALSDAGVTVARMGALTDWIDGGRLDLILDQIAADLPSRITKNTAFTNFMFKMLDSTDHVTAETGLTITATRSLDGAAFAACTNSATEVSGGWYKIDLAAGDVNGNMVVLKFTATGADTREVAIVTQP